MRINFLFSSISRMLVFLFSGQIAIAQEWVPFRNALNEGTYWFYEKQMDSAVVYFHKAEEIKPELFYPEAHLYSRALWEQGKREKSMEVLMYYGVAEYFENDTTFYEGLTPDLRFAMLRKMKKMDEYSQNPEARLLDSLQKNEQIWRLKLKKEKANTPAYKDLQLKIKKTDSLNCEQAMIYLNSVNEITVYQHFPEIIPTVFGHADSLWLAVHQTDLLDLLQQGKLSPYAYALVMDRILGTGKGKKPFNVWKPDAKVENPKEVFKNCKAIGLNPYYFNENWLIFPRGVKPQVTMLFTFFSTHKTEYNATH